MVTIEVASANDVPAIAGMLANAFVLLPVSEWLVPDAIARRRVLAANFEILVAHATHVGVVYLIRSTDPESGVIAAAVWLPGQAPMPFDYDDRLAAACGPFTDRFAQLDELFADHHPAEPHDHLALLGVHPSHQNAGLGAALLTHHLVQLDRVGSPASLHASSPGSQRLYQAFGFLADDPFYPPGAPDAVFWPMWRKPRPDPRLGRR